MDTYKQRNAGVLTASKIKCFLKSPEAYYIEYLSDIPLEREESTAFLLGTAFDYYLCYGPIEFHKKYYLKEGRGKPEEGETRIDLNNTEWEKVIGMVQEAIRQPLWEVADGKYEPQKVVECEFKGLKLRGTLDRLSLEMGVIRDFKTTSSLKNFSFELASKYNYELSMAFYFALVKVAYGVDCNCYLDVVQSSGVYQSEVFMYQKEKMNQVLAEVIIPALDKFIVIQKAWEETGDVDVWMEGGTGNRWDTYDCASYPYLKSGLQTSISFI